jgi:dienelactone hydrolase
MRWSSVVATAVLAFACARGEQGGGGPRVETREFDYQSPDGAALQGFMAWDAAKQGTRPGILVVHEWWGHNELARHQARRLAEAGYVAMALDMFGKGKVTTHPEEAQAFVNDVVKDPALTEGRFLAALEQLKRDPHVDSTHVGAVGYCFGGMVVLSMARAGLPLDAVSAIHALMPEGPVDSGKVRARVLVANGEADPFVPLDKVTAFKQAMEKAGARIEVMTFPGAKHGFTNQRAASFGMDALVYDGHADTASWEATIRTFHDAWGGH